MTYLPDSMELDGEDIACLGMRRADRSDFFADLNRQAFEEAVARLPKPPKPRQTRKPSIRTLVKQAERASGKTVTSITTPDGTTLHFGEPEPTEATNPWLVNIDKARKR